MEEGTSLRDHLDQLNKIMLNLCNVEVKVDDEDAALIMVLSLPLLYENFVINSYMGGKDTMCLEEVMFTLLTREVHYRVVGSTIKGQESRLAAIGSKGQKRLW